MLHGVTLSLVQVTIAVISAIVLVSAAVITPITHQVERTKRQVLRVFLDVPMVVLRRLRQTAEKRLVAFASEVKGEDGDNLSVEGMSVRGHCRLSDPQSNNISPHRIP